MSPRTHYSPGPATGAEVKKDGNDWTLVLVRELRHPPAKVWKALTDPDQLRQWAPFDSDRNLGTAGTAILSTVGASFVSETTVKRAEPNKALEYNWGGGDMRWELEPTAAGTRLTLWTQINRGFISMGASGWHICFDVLDHLLSDDPIGRLAGPDAMQVEGWDRLNAEYAEQFGVRVPKLPNKERN
jgi:uncharacterized protein YndB with AHSA1/START domain